MKKWLTFAFLAGAVLVSACGLASPAKLAVTYTGVPALTTGAASIDVVDIDQAAHRLYAADRTDQGVDVLDVSSPAARYLKTIPIQADPNGIAVAPDLGEVFVGVSDGSVDVIDVRQGSATVDTVVRRIATGAGSVDLIDYSARQHRLFASNGIHGTIAAIDTSSGLVAGLFKVGYALEQPRFNPGDGLLYVTSPDAGALFQLDPATGTVKNKIALSGCSPSGLAINAKTNQAMVACGSSVTRVNLRDTADVSTFLDVSGGDVVAYDASVDRFFVAAPAVKPSSQVGLFGGNPIAFIRSVDTGAGGNSAAYDETNGIVYTPDTRPGKAGIAGFGLPSGQPTLSASPADLAYFGALLAVAALAMFVVGRQADPVRRQEPTAPRRRA